MDKALDYMYRASRIVSVAVKHIDVAVAVLSRFLDPKELASLADFPDKVAYISEVWPKPDNPSSSVQFIHQSECPIHDPI